VWIWLFLCSCTLLFEISVVVITIKCETWVSSLVQKTHEGGMFVRTKTTTFTLNFDAVRYQNKCSCAPILNFSPQCAKFEVASFSRCRNIKGEANNFGSFPSPGPHPLFSYSGIWWWALANPSRMPNLKSLVSSVNIKESVFKRQIRLLSHPLGE